MATKRTLGILGASAAMLVALTGCSQTAAVSVTPAAQGAKVSQKTIASEQPLVIAASVAGNYQDNFNPFSTSADSGTLGLLYQPLYYFDNISKNVYPLLGTSYAWSNGNKTMTVNLRKGVKWSDGKQFTSADVLFSYNLLKKYPAADINGIWSQLASMHANGPYQVVFNLKSANVPFASYLLGAYIVPQHLWTKMGDPTKAIVKKPVGTGPYVLSSFNPQIYKFQANNQYWGGEPAVRNVEYPAYSGNDSANLALAKGQIDWAGIFIPSIQSIYASKSPHNKYWFPPANDVMLYTNLQNPLLSQLPVRKAISLAINRQQIYMEGEYGYEPVASPTGLVLPNANSFVDKSLPAADLKFSYNPAAAIKILENAGFKKNASGIFAKNGQPLSFTLQVVSGWTDWDTDCSLIQQDLKAIGIQVTVQQEQFGAYFSNINSPKKNYQLAISWTNTGPSPYFLYQNMLNSKGGFNVEQLKSPMIDKTLALYAGSSNPAVQQRALDVLQKYMAEQLPSIPLVYGATWYEYNDANYTGWPTASNAYVFPAPYQAVAQSIVLTHLRPR